MEAESDPEREIRAARNQSIFRAVNEQIRAVNDTFAALTETFAVTCECFDSRCLAMIRIAPGAYEDVRSHPHRFVVLPGHVLAEVERVVAETDEYVVVEKARVAAEVAEVLDPRGA